MAMTRETTKSVASIKPTICTQLEIMLSASQCSLQYEPIFRLLLKVAVNGTHQCESHQFLQGLRPNNTERRAQGTFIRSLIRSPLQSLVYSFIGIGEPEAQANRGEPTEATANGASAKQGTCVVDKS